MPPKFPPSPSLCSPALGAPDTLYAGLNLTLQCEVTLLTVTGRQQHGDMISSPWINSGIEDQVTEVIIVGTLSLTNEPADSRSASQSWAFVTLHIKVML